MTVPEVQEVEATSAPLMAAGRHFGKACEAPSLAFMQCKEDNGQDPSKCLKEGAKVTRCALEFFKELRQNCNEEYTNHWTCLDNNNQDMTKCGPTKEEYNECVFQKMGIELPEIKPYDD
eukprot:Nk52_evm4s2209 gene=Nk52_evmTU4s2209